VTCVVVAAVVVQVGVRHKRKLCGVGYDFGK
jgi:hypothetical protein